MVMLTNGPGVQVSVRGMRDLSFPSSDPDRLLAALADQDARTTGTDERTEHR
jgi:hypothetical protein